MLPSTLEIPFEITLKILGATLAYRMSARNKVPKSISGNNWGSDKGVINLTYAKRLKVEAHATQLLFSP